MENIKVTCTRCDGSGKFSFNLQKGDVCFGCNGIGYKIVDKKKNDASVKKAKAAKIKKDKERADHEEKTKAFNDFLVNKYANDSRIGVETKSKIDAGYEAFMWGSYMALNAIDTCTVFYCPFDFTK
jgi:hypothetical protein